ncbi:Ser/Thr protein kinase RdoA (MazF antagonist) [Streptacidiphilus sp. BW17]|uniref:phosphotransferase enzyme family protein n=1 Tax=unclassified Streptacidiphilus TaxID=2643834 RepID=UPI003513F4F4
MSREDEIVALLAAHHGLPGAVVERVPLGTETDNYQATSVGLRFFVKAYRPGTDLTETAAGLEASDFARRGGCPIPALRPGRHGSLLTAAGGLAVSVWDWIEAAPATGPLAPAEGAQIGVMLARLHQRLAAYPHPGRFRPTSEPWWCRDTAPVHDLGRRILAAIDALPTPTKADLLHHERVRQRLEDLRFVPALQAGLPPDLPMQLVHCDVTRPNLLFAAGGDLAAVVDLRGRVLHPAWEVGRIAYDPLTVATSSNWRTFANSVVAAYAEHAPPAALAQLHFSARLTLLQALQTWFGLADTYLQPTTGADPDGIRYWNNRYEMSRELLQHLPTIEDELTDLLGPVTTRPTN